jgi:hypothetical protein
VVGWLKNELFAILDMEFGWAFGARKVAWRGKKVWRCICIGRRRWYMAQVGVIEYI